MAYTDFTLETAEAELAVTAQPGVLFPGLRPLAVPDWLQDPLDAVVWPWSARRLGASSSWRRPAGGPRTVRRSGRHPVRPASGRGPGSPITRSVISSCAVRFAPAITPPLLAVVEAKKNDIDAGLGQCVARDGRGANYNE